MTKMKRILGTMSALALTGGSTVLAAPVATDSTDAKTGFAGLEEIVVTAQKREERLIPERSFGTDLVIIKLIRSHRMAGCRLTRRSTT
jgi:hypothetical protein